MVLLSQRGCLKLGLALGSGFLVSVISGLIPHSSVNAFFIYLLFFGGPVHLCVCVCACVLCVCVCV